MRVWRLAVGVLLAASVTVGCSHMQDGADPFVLRMQQDIEVGWEIADSFLRIEYANSEQMAKVAPWAPSVANQIREQWPGIERTAWAALDAYRLARVAVEKAQAANNEQEGQRAEQARVEARQAVIIAVEKLTAFVTQARAAISNWKGGGR